jgi:hypothetical protein
MKFKRRSITLVGQYWQSVCTMSLSEEIPAGYEDGFCRDSQASCLCDTAFSDGVSGAIIAAAAGNLLE